MAGGRRNPFRATSFKHSEVDSKNATGGPIIRHIPLPEIPKLSMTTFELGMCMFCIIMLAAQYLNIYRTVFWLPHSYTKHALNLYLIEPRVVVFIVVSVSRRLCWCIVKALLTWCLHVTLWKTAIPIARIVVVLLLTAVLAYCLSTISTSVTFIKSIALAYPLCLYFFIFDLELTSFLEVIPPAVQCKEEVSGRPKTSTIRLVQHNCANNNDGVRSEAEFLASHCYKRISQVVYQSLVTVYYTTLIPCFFVPNSLHYDAYWLTAHSLFVLITCVLWHFVYCFPAKFCDIVHRSVLHLGSWARLPNAVGSGVPVWSSGATYSKGALVKHGRDIWRAEGLSNAAEPGNALHARLYAMFSEVHRLKRIVFWVGLISAILYLAYIITLKQWQQIIASGIAQAAHYGVLYWLLRDFVVLKNIDKQEMSLNSM